MSAPDVRRLLEDLGSIEAPSPDPDFIDRLEFQLRAETIALAPQTAYDDAPWRVPFGIAAAAFTVVAGVAGITVIRDMPERQVSAQLAAATNAKVTLPNGEEFDAVPGMVIPKGAVVEVFSGGLAEINGVKLAPGSRVVVTGDGGVKSIDADDVPISDDVEMAAPGEGSRGDRSEARLDPSFPGRDSEPATGDGVTPGLPSGDDAGPLRQAERTTKSRGLDALRRTSDDAPPQTSVAGPAPSVDRDVPSTDQAAPPATEPPATTSAPAPEAGPAPAPPEIAAPTTAPPATDAPTTEPPATTTPEPQVPSTTPAPTVPPTTTPPTPAPEPTPPPSTTPDPSVPAVPPSGTTTTTTPDVDPAGGEDGGEVTPPGTPGKGEDGGEGGDPTDYDTGSAPQPKTSDDPATGDETAAAEADADADADSESGDSAEDPGPDTDETASAETAAAS